MTPVAIAAKFGTKSTITRLRKSFRTTGVFGAWLLNDTRKFYHDQPPLPWQRNLRQNIGFNSACIRDISEMFASNRGFSGSGYRMMSVKFLQRPTLVATATKFETKQAITALV